jgi:tripartite-type tricarboxylate transporter receptor subunit TctC
LIVLALLFSYGITPIRWPDMPTELADVKERLATFGFEGSANTPEESATLIRAESAKWAKVIQDAGVKTR